ncbi:segregation/condensation protein A [Microaerobacter geothermalis]|uniref:segregation and condensation protein A n=1 Tax=Microaerobacter geothermalis TaxID=674972 RepID=UPI001F359B3C|nr:segregation/condensation protein A [Microaerobacter geothermalis]MCF6093486.1 segregation/condensation protein A [Microaerobacter geothermalis]
MSYLIKIDAFEGPLDLLLHLIDKAEVDIYNISIAEITEQYLSYLHTMQELQLEVASEFIVMAATLLSIKSKMLLPKNVQYSFQPSFDIEDDEINTREELIKRLIEYRKYKEAAESLREKELTRSQLFTRPPMNLQSFVTVEEENPVGNVTLYDLLKALSDALKRADHGPKMVHIERDEISIKDRMNEILNLLKQHSTLSFSQLTPQQNISKVIVVVTFLAVLELIKKGKIECHQQGLFSEIILIRKM